MFNNSLMDLAEVFLSQLRNEDTIMNPEFNIVGCQNMLTLKTRCWNRLESQVKSMKVTFAASCAYSTSLSPMCLLSFGLRQRKHPMSNSKASDQSKARQPFAQTNCSSKTYYPPAIIQVASSGFHNINQYKPVYINEAI